MTITLEGFFLSVLGVIAVLAAVDFALSFVYPVKEKQETKDVQHPPGSNR